MPTPFQVLADAVSLIIMAMYLVLMYGKHFPLREDCRPFAFGEQKVSLPFSSSFSIDLPAAILCSLAPVNPIDRPDRHECRVSVSSWRFFVRTWNVCMAQEHA